jgi:hypothetical protein
MKKSVEHGGKERKINFESRHRAEGKFCEKKSKKKNSTRLPAKNIYIMFGKTSRGRERKLFSLKSLAVTSMSLMPSQKRSHSSARQCAVRLRFSWSCRWRQPERRQNKQREVQSAWEPKSIAPDGMLRNVFALWRAIVFCSRASFALRKWENIFLVRQQSQFYSCSWIFNIVEAEKLSFRK